MFVSSPIGNEIELIACCVDEGFRRKHIASAMLRELIHVYGTGEMWDYRSSVYCRDNNLDNNQIKYPPWNRWGISFDSLSLKNGITHIGECAFTDCFISGALKIPNSVTSIGDYFLDEVSRYGKTREECEILLTERIEEVRAKIAEEKAKKKAGMTPTS